MATTTAPTATTFRRSPTKDEELAHFAAFLSTIHPSSYLADFLADAMDEFEAGIRQDIVFPRINSIRQLDRDHREALDRMNQARREIAAAEAKLRGLAQQEEQARRQLQTLAEDAEHLSRKARNAITAR